LKKAIKQAHEAKAATSRRKSSMVGVSAKRMSQKYQRTSLDASQTDRHYGTLAEHNISSLPRDSLTNDARSATSSQHPVHPKEADVAPPQPNVPLAKVITFDPSAMTPNSPPVPRQPLLPSFSEESITSVPVTPRRRHFRNFSTQSSLNMLRRVSLNFSWPLSPLDQVNETRSHSRQSSRGKNEATPINQMISEGMTF
jgi:hypothetical protein